MTGSHFTSAEGKQRRAGDSPAARQHTARVTAVDRDRYVIQDGDRDVPAELTGALRFSAASNVDLPCVGDWVHIQTYDEGSFAIIHEVLPRTSFLRRKAAGKDIEHQMIAANVDVALIMQSCDADFNVRRLERYLVMVNEGSIEPILLLSKTDLASPGVVHTRIAELARAAISIRIIPLSTQSGSGLDDVRALLQSGRTYCLLGSSGVGKTTLINHLVGRDLYATNEVRTKDGKGKHTTARRQLIILPNGALLVDTPGMRELGMLGVSEGLRDSFPELSELSAQCRFANCSHEQEPGCAIREAVARGMVTEDRYRSYLKILRESAFHDMSYVERRQKDKQFGRMVHSAMKHHPKK